MPLNVFDEQVNASYNFTEKGDSLTPAKRIHQTREFQSSLRSNNFKSIEVVVSNVKVSAFKDGQEVDLSESNFDITLQLIPCAQTAIRDEKNRCKLSVYKEVNLVRLQKKRIVFNIEKRGSLILRVIVKDEDPKNPLPAEVLSGLKLNVEYKYTIQEKYQSYENIRAQSKLVDDLKSSLSKALAKVRLLTSQVVSSKTEETT